MSNNKKILASAFLAASATAASFNASAQSKVEIYGLLDSAVEVTNNGLGTNARVVSGALAANRIGFRGREDLGGGLTALFKLEEGLNTDTGTLGQGGLAWGREASVGLTSARLGTLTLGRTPMPYYQLSIAVDAFVFGHTGGFLAATRSTPTGARQLLPVQATARVDNSFLYVTPTYAGFEARLQGGLGEGSTSQGRVYGGSLQYAAGPWNVIAAGERVNGASNSNGSAKAIMVGGNYDFGVAKLFLGYTRENNDCTTCAGGLLRVQGTTPTGVSDFRFINAGTRIPVGAMTYIAQVTRIQDRSQYAAVTGSRDATWISVGGEYSLSKRTILFASAGTIDNRSGSSYVLGTGGAQQPANAVAPGNPRGKTASVGVSHSF